MPRRNEKPSEREAAVGAEAGAVDLLVRSQAKQHDVAAGPERRRRQRGELTGRHGGGGAAEQLAVAGEDALVNLLVGVGDGEGDFDGLEGADVFARAGAQDAALVLGSGVARVAVTNGQTPRQET